jgi:4a-hydroxytetrahydrobiopterin dehydratase
MAGCAPGPLVWFDGGMDKLTADDIRAALSDLPEWEYDGQRLSRTYRFASFRDAITFINGVAAAAEAADHHPDIENTYDRVTLHLRTHSADAVTTKDLELARAADAVARDI